MDYKRLIWVFVIFSFLSVFLIFSFVEKKNEADANKRKALEDEEIEKDNLESEIETTSDDSPEEEELNDVTMILSSVSKDIRIRVMSDEGIASGTAWVADVRDEYGNLQIVRDEDRDGLIRLSELSSGKYYVCLEPEAGFRVPQDEILMSVRDQISYTAIPDISFEIKTEDQIDPTVEDTAFSEEVDDKDYFENQKLAPEGIKGIDVSKWNKVIDWQKVKEDGIEYAIIRCGYRGSSTGALVLDPYWEVNYRGAKEAGIKIGVYFFTQAMNETEAVEEASMVLSLLGGEKTDYPIFLDVEGSGGRADVIDNATRTQVINAFCSTINSAGQKSGVYANKSWYTNKINTSELRDMYIWYAQYRVGNPTYEGHYDIWQYTSKGSVDGIEGYVDMNLSYIDF